jgi:hypothetical protein
LTAEEQRLIAERQARFAAMTDDEREAYLAELDDANRLRAAREAEREHRLHQIGIGLIWFATVVLAFGIGYSAHGRYAGQAAVLIITAVVCGAFVLGAVLAQDNRHRRDQPPSG